MQMLCAYGIEEVYFRDVYEISEASAVAEMYGVNLRQLEHYPHIA
jgi:dCMP deaminase